MKIKVNDAITSSAEWSPCKQYRYVLRRNQWRADGMVNFICLNPSTADESTNDPTCLRCMKRAFEIGILGHIYREVVVTNIFAYRSTDPKGLRDVTDPVGPDNNRWLVEVAKEAAIVIVAWGEHGARFRRCGEVIAMLKEFDIRLYCLGTNDSLHPRHPLYISYKVDAQPYEAT